MRPVPLNIPSISSPLRSSFGLVNVFFYFQKTPIVALSIPDILMKLLGLMRSSSEKIEGSPLSTWIDSVLL